MIKLYHKKLILQECALEEPLSLHLLIVETINQLGNKYLDMYFDTKYATK